MRVTVAGKQVETGDALKVHVTEGLTGISRKYFDHALDARVVFSRDSKRDGTAYLCGIDMHAGRGLSMRAEGSGVDAHRAFDEAAEHIAKRLRRYRRRVNEHARHLADERTPKAEEAREIILRNSDGEDEDTPTGEADVPHHGAVVAENTSELSTLTVREAVMRLDLSQTLVILFRNRATGTLNVVYRRGDGHIGWIDPGRD